MMLNTQNKKLIGIYFLSIFAVTVPFWLLGSVTEIRGLPFAMQLSALVVLALPLVTLAFIVRTYGKRGVRHALRDCLPGRASARWVAAAFLTVPLVAATAFLITAHTVPFGGWAVPLVSLPLYFAIYYVAAACEELGWTWYATPLMLRHYGVVMTGLGVGAVWALIHVLPWYQQQGIWFMGGMALFTIVNRVVMTWLYVKSRKTLWLVIAYHAMINTVFTAFYTASPYASPLLYTAILLGMLCISLLVAKRRAH